MAAPARPSAGSAPEPAMAWTEKSHSSVRTSAARMDAMQWRSAGELAQHSGWEAAHLAKLSASSFQ
eukprot:8981583-Lingulodinium_polyedra.AAC.1